MRRQRLKRGIPAFVPPAAWDRSLLGVLPDAVVARIAGITRGSVTEMRKRLGIRPPRSRCVTTEGESANYPEAVIDLYWHQTGVKHRFQCRVGRYIADWMIHDDTLVEYVGYRTTRHLGRRAQYEERLACKLAFYREQGWKVLLIEETELARYHTGLAPTVNTTCQVCGAPAYYQRRLMCRPCARRTLPAAVLPRSGTTVCVQCHRVFGSRGVRRGLVRHASHGLCQACYEYRVRPSPKQRFRPSVGSMD